jgi:hypothetical protein
MPGPTGSAPRQRGCAPYCRPREATRPSGDRVDITPFVRPDIHESRALEPHYHFRQPLVWNSKHHRVSINRSGRCLRRIEPQSKLAENLVNRGGRLVPRRSVHHHDRVTQSRSPYKCSKKQLISLRPPFGHAVQPEREHLPCQRGRGQKPARLSGSLDTSQRLPANVGETYGSVLPSIPIRYRIFSTPNKGA